MGPVDSCVLPPNLFFHPTKDFAAFTQMGQTLSPLDRLLSHRRLIGEFLHDSHFERFFPGPPFGKLNGLVERVLGHLVMKDRQFGSRHRDADLNFVGAHQPSVNSHDALVMAAAVADYGPTEAADQKIKKSDDDLNITLSKTTDILKTAKGHFVRVGFAAESQNLVANAKAKVDSKKLDLIVANDITAEGSGFGSDTNQVTLIDRDLVVEELPLLSKYDVSNRILDRVKDLFRD